MKVSNHTGDIWPHLKWQNVNFKNWYFSSWSINTQIRLVTEILHYICGLGKKKCVVFRTTWGKHVNAKRPFQIGPWCRVGNVEAFSPVGKARCSPFEKIFRMKVKFSVGHNWGLCGIDPGKDSPKKIFIQICIHFYTFVHFIHYIKDFYNSRSFLKN